MKAQDEVLGTMEFEHKSRRDDITMRVGSWEASKKRNFEEEFIALLEAHNVDYDPRYVFG